MSDTTANTVEIVLKGRDLVKPAADSARASIMSLKAPINSLTVAFGNLQAQAASWAAVHVKALASSVTAALKEADSITKMAQRMGVAVDQLSGLAYAGELADTSIGDLAISSRYLAQNMQAAAEGTDSQKKKFEVLGVSVKDANGRLREFLPVFSEIADWFAQMPDGSRKSALAFELLGRSGTNLIPLLNQGSEAIRKQIAQAKEFGIVIDKDFGKQAEYFNDALTGLKAQSHGLAMSLAREAVPALNDFVDGVRVLIDTQGPLMDFWKEFGRVVRKEIDGIVGVMSTLAGAYSFVSTIGGIGKGNRQMQAAASANFSANPQWVGFGGNAAAGTPATQSIGAALKAAEEAYSKGRDAFLAAIVKQQIQRSSSTGGMGGGFAESLAQATAKDRLSFEMQRLEVLRKAETSEEGITDSIKEELDIARKVHDLTLADVGLMAAKDKNSREALDAQKEALTAYSQVIKLERELAAVERKRWDESYLGQTQNAFDDFRLRQYTESQYGIGASFTAGLQEAMMQFGTLAEQIGHTIRDVIVTAVDSISDSLTGVIMRTKSWGQAMREIGTSIMTEIVHSIVQMGVQFVTTQVVMRAAAMATSAIMTAIGVKQKAENAQSFATGAMAGVGQSGAQGGWIGVLIYMGVLAAAIAAVTAMAGGFESGGYTGDGNRKQVAGVVHKGEYVLPASAVDRIGIPALESLRAGAYGSSGEAGQTRIVIVDSRRQADALRRDPRFRNLVVDLMERSA